MMLNDYRCNDCKISFKDVYTKSGKPDCPQCGKPLEVDFSSWDSVNFARPFSESMRNATDTGTNSFGALHDPVCKSELGLGASKYSVLEGGESAEFGRRLLKEGDSPALRKDIKSAREREIKKKKANKNV